MIFMSTTGLQFQSGLLVNGGYLYLLIRCVVVVERDPKKRRVKPLETQTSILDFDLEESSDDSDFRIEDHANGSDDDSLDSNAQGK